VDVGGEGSFVLVEEPEVALRTAFGGAAFDAVISRQGRSAERNFGQEISGNRSFPA